MREIKEQNDDAVTPVISVILVTAAVFVAAAVVWGGIYSDVSGDVTVEAVMEFEDQPASNSTIITLKHLGNADRVEVYYFDSPDYNGTPELYEFEIPGDTENHTYGDSPGAYRVVGHSGDTTQVIQNIVIGNNSN